MGHGGAKVECCKLRTLWRVAAGSVPRYWVICPLANRSKRNPFLAMPRKNVAGFIAAVADRCATMSRIVQPAHSDGMSHCDGVKPARSLASALRSAATVDQKSATASGLRVGRCSVAHGFHWLLRRCIRALTHRGPTLSRAFTAKATRGAIRTGRVRAAVSIQSAASSEVKAGIPA